MPETFIFSVKCHRDLTHKYLLSPTKGAGGLLEANLDICRRLHSNLLVLETPLSFNPNQAVDNINDLLSQARLDDIRLVWEIRWEPPGKELVKLMQEFNIVHSVDLSRDPGTAFESDILYSACSGTVCTTCTSSMMPNCWRNWIKRCMGVWGKWWKD